MPDTHPQRNVYTHTYITPIQWPKGAVGVQAVEDAEIAEAIRRSLEGAKPDDAALAGSLQKEDLARAPRAYTLKS